MTYSGFLKVKINFKSQGDCDSKDARRRYGIPYRVRHPFLQSFNTHISLLFLLAVFFFFFYGLYLKKVPDSVVTSQCLVSKEGQQGNPLWSRQLGSENFCAAQGENRKQVMKGLTRCSTKTWSSSAGRWPSAGALQLRGLASSPVFDSDLVPLRALSGWFKQLSFTCIVSWSLPHTDFLWMHWGFMVCILLCSSECYVPL